MENEVDVLLIEDKKSDAELTIRALKKNNSITNLLHLKDGEEALDFIFAKGKYVDRNVEYVPKVILLDLKMPKVDGIQVLQKIKTDARTKNIPVVILSSSKEDTDIEKCYELGVNSYVVKPVRFEEFTKTISQLGLYWVTLNHK